MSWCRRLVRRAAARRLGVALVRPLADLSAARRGASLAGMGVIVQRQVDAALSGVLFTVAPDHDGEMAVEYCGGAGRGARLRTRQSRPHHRSTGERCGWSSAARSGAPTRPRRPVRAADTHASGRWRAARSTSSAPSAVRRTSNGRWTAAAGSGSCSRGRSRSRRASLVRADAATRRMISGRTPTSTRTSRSRSRRCSTRIARTRLLPLLPQPRAARSACRAAASRAMEQPLRHIIGVHGARMYYNLTSIHGVLRSAPFGDLLAAWFNQFVGSEDTDTPAAVGRADRERRPRRAVGCRASRRRASSRVIAAKTTWQYLFVTRRVERFERTVTAFAAAHAPRRLPRRGRASSLPAIFARFSTSAATAGSTRRSPTRRRWSATARCSASCGRAFPAPIRPRCTTAC